MVEEKMMGEDETVTYINEKLFPISKKSFRKIKENEPKLPFYKVARMNYYKKCDVNDWVERLKINPAPLDIKEPDD